MANANKTNSNAYTIIYAACLVIVVALLLSVVASVLKPQQVANEKIDKKAQILSAINIADDDVEAAYAKYVSKAVAVDAQGNEVAGKDGFDVDFNGESSADLMPLYVCNVNNEVKYIIPLRGAGLWGPIWGYVGLNSDKSTIYGITFGHESETAGLGAEIVTEKFTSRFTGKNIKNAGNVVSVAVVKKGTKVDGQDQVDAISGATLTSNGVNVMLKDCLGKYNSFLTK